MNSNVFCIAGYYAQLYAFKINSCTVSSAVSLRSFMVFSRLSQKSASILFLPAPSRRGSCRTCSTSPANIILTVQFTETQTDGWKMVSAGYTFYFSSSESYQVFFPHSFSKLHTLRKQDLRGHDIICLISNSLIQATVKFWDEFLSAQMKHTSPEIIVIPFHSLMSETIKTSVGTTGHNLFIKTSQ